MSQQQSPPSEAQDYAQLQQDITGARAYLAYVNSSAYEAAVRKEIGPQALTLDPSAAAKTVDDRRKAAREQLNALLRLKNSVDELRRKGAADEARSVLADKRDERLAEASIRQAELAGTREERLTRAQEQSNEIARGRLAVDEAQQRLAERRAEIEADVATGRLTLDQGKLEWDKEHAGLQIAERALDRLETRRRHEEELATTLRGQDISQRGQDVSLAERLGGTAQEAALGAFRASSPEGTTAFFNEALRGLGPFSPGGVEAIPQLARPAQIRIPQNITDVGVRTAGGILGGQIPVLPPQVERPQLPAFQAAGVISPQEAQAVDEVLADVLANLAQGGEG